MYWLPDQGSGQYIDATAEVQGIDEQEETKQHQQHAQFPVGMTDEGKQFLGDLHGALAAIGASPREAALEFLKDPAAAAKRYGAALSKLTGSPEDDIGADLLETVREVKGQVAALVEAEGVDPREFNGFLSANRHAAHAAILDALDGHAGTMKRLITRFKSERPNYRRPTPEGVKTRKTQDGTQYVRVKLPNGRGIEVSVANARMQGWIR